MDYLFSQHDLSFLDDVIPEKDKKKKEDEKRKKKKKESLDSDIDDVRNFPEFQSNASERNIMWKINFFILYVRCMSEFRKCLLVHVTCQSSPSFTLYFLSLVFLYFLKPFFNH